MRKLIGPEMGSVLIIVVFISAKTLGRRGVKSYWPCARLFPPPFERGQGSANGAANSSPVKRPVDWAAADDRARHAAHMGDDLLSSTYLLRISSQGSAASRFRIISTISIHKNGLPHRRASCYWTCGGFSPPSFERLSGPNKGKTVLNVTDSRVTTWALAGPKVQGHEQSIDSIPDDLHSNTDQQKRREANHDGGPC